MGLLSFSLCGCPANGSTRAIVNPAMPLGRNCHCLPKLLRFPSGVLRGSQSNIQLLILNKITFPGYKGEYLAALASMPRSAHIKSKAANELSLKGIDLQTKVSKMAPLKVCISAPPSQTPVSKCCSSFKNISCHYTPFPISQMKNYVMKFCRPLYPKNRSVFCLHLNRLRLRNA